jgi:hypothetical protein
MTDSSGTRGVVVVVVDDADPRDPAALCDRCGVRGTIARATRHTEPPIVTRYCGACWPEAQAALEAQLAAERADRRDAYRRWAESSHRNPAGAPPRPTAAPAFSSASRSWHDTRRFLQRFMPDDAPPSRLADLARAAKDIRTRAPQMEGPMPPDIAAFVDRYDPPAT